MILVFKYFCQTLRIMERKTKRVTIRFPSELDNILSYVARTSGISKSEVIRVALINYIQLLNFLSNHKKKLEKLIKI